MGTTSYCVELKDVEMNRKSPLFATYNKNIVIKILYLSLLSWILLPMIASASEVGPTIYLYRDTYYQTIDEAESVMRDYVDTITTYQPYEI